MAHLIIRGECVWCSFCNDYTRFLRVQSAARIADVNRRTIYRYVEEGRVNVLKVAGKTLRVCGGCLLGHAEGSPPAEEV